MEETLYALIKNEIVENIIVATEGFIKVACTHYDACVEVTDLEVKPSIGWKYIEGEFSPPE